MQINILVSRDPISFFFFYPLMALRKDLRQWDCRISFFDDILPQLCEADVVVLDNRCFSPLWASQSDLALSRLKGLRQRAKRLFWADVTDSTGATQFQVMPFVDRYFKKQLLRCRHEYTRSFYGARIYTDYYKKNQALPAEDVFAAQAIREQDLSKLALSWNLGLGGMAVNSGASRLAGILPPALVSLFPVKLRGRVYRSTDRPNDICFRGSERYNNQALAFQRLEIIRRLQKRGIATRPIARPQYLAELRRTKICVSPFGAGEICFRDFEIFSNGGLLFKPDMSHLETWPDFYQADRTYVPFRWDFSDFDEQIDRLLAEPQRIADISRQAQEQYRKFFTEQGEQQFCERFIKLME